MGNSMRRNWFQSVVDLDNILLGIMTIFGVLAAAAAVGLVLAWAGVLEPEPGAVEVDPLGDMIKAGGLRHIQDQQTGNCYAYTTFDGRPVVTWIPCTSEAP